MTSILMAALNGCDDMGRLLTNSIGATIHNGTQTVLTKLGKPCNQTPDCVTPFGLDVITMTTTSMTTIGYDDVNEQSMTTINDDGVNKPFLMTIYYDYVNETHSAQTVACLP